MPPSCNCIAGPLNALRASRPLRPNLSAASVRRWGAQASITRPMPVQSQIQSQRLFSNSSARWKLKTIEQIQTRNKGGVSELCFLKENSARYFQSIPLSGALSTSFENLKLIYCFLDNSPSISPPRSFSLPPARACGHTSTTRRSGWRDSGLRSRRRG